VGVQRLVIVAAVVLAAVAVVFMRSNFDSTPQGYQWNLPDHVPPPPVPADNPMTAIKVELGRLLFYDKRLSVNETTSCASCHIQELAFTDGVARAVGATGERHPRGAMSLVNTAYVTRLNWANHLLDRIEFQALVPLFGEQPVEMGMSGQENQIVAMLKSEPRYAERFPNAFPNDEDPYSILNMVRAIASFVRSINAFDSPYDRYLAGDASAMSDDAVQGMLLFFSEQLECFHCHGGINFTDSSTHANATVDVVGFHNNGLYNIDGAGQYPTENTGLHELTGKRRDMGRFKAPTLRNIALTAPYMHDGSVATLNDVIAHYEVGGRTIAEGPYAGDGRRNPYKSVFVRPFELSSGERRQLIAFLNSLTDDAVLADPQFSDPYPVEAEKTVRD